MSLEGRFQVTLSWGTLVCIGLYSAYIYIYRYMCIFFLCIDMCVSKCVHVCVYVCVCACMSGAVAKSGLFGIDGLQRWPSKGRLDWKPGRPPQSFGPRP